MKKLFLGKIVKICKFYSWKSGPFFNYKMVHFSLDKYSTKREKKMKNKGYEGKQQYEKEEHMKTLKNT